MAPLGGEGAQIQLAEDKVRAQPREQRREQTLVEVVGDAALAHPEGCLGILLAYLLDDFLGHAPPLHNEPQWIDVDTAEALGLIKIQHRVGEAAPRLEVRFM